MLSNKNFEVKDINLLSKVVRWFTSNKSIRENQYMFFQDYKWYDLRKLDGLYGTFVIKVDINISNLSLQELPNLSNVVCLGDFDCSYNQLLSLEGAPKKVLGTFKCSFNRAKSLIGGPKTAKKLFRNFAGCPRRCRKI